MTADDALRLAHVRELTATGKAEEIRVRARLSRAEVAAACNVAESTIWQWEKDGRAPRGEPALRYAELLDRLAETTAA